MLSDSTLLAQNKCKHRNKKISGNYCDVKNDGWNLSSSFCMFMKNKLKLLFKKKKYKVIPQYDKLSVCNISDSNICYIKCL